MSYIYIYIYIYTYFNDIYICVCIYIYLYYIYIHTIDVYVYKYLHTYTYPMHISLHIPLPFLHPIPHEALPETSNMATEETTTGYSAVFCCSPLKGTFENWIEIKGESGNLIIGKFIEIGLESI